MKQRKMKLRRASIGILLSYFLIAPGGPVGAKMANPCDDVRIHMQKGTPDHDPTGTTGRAPRTGGLRIVDPETGEMASLPTPGIMPQALVESMDTSQVGLHEEPDAAGGTMVDLKGRFKPMLKIPQAQPRETQSRCARK